MKTGYPDVEQVLGRLVPGMRGVLGVRLLGAYVFGSVGSGDYDPDVSDVDVLSVVESPVTDAEFGALAVMHSGLAAALPEWDNRIEVLYVSTEALRTFREHSSPIAVISPGEPLNVKLAGIEWLMNWWDVREAGVTLIGPPASTFIAPIAREEFVAIIQSYAESFPGRLDESPYARWLAYCTLTMCRSLYTCAEGGPVSKRAAAAWVANRYPRWADHVRGALAERLAWRDGTPANIENRQATAAFVEFALAELRLKGK